MDDHGKREKSDAEPLGSDPGEVACSGKDSGAGGRRHCVPPWSWAILASAAAWAILMVAIPPAAQNFPLGDDWAFARGAFWFAHGEGIHYSKWASMPQLGQWLFSLPFILVMGPTHVALRASTIVLSWLGIASLYHLLHREGFFPRLAAFTCCVVVMNPLFFVSQSTYMTDVPAMSLAMIALNCYGQAMTQRHRLWLATAVVAAILGCITRQTLIFVPIVAAIMLLRRPDLRLKFTWALSVIGPGVMGVATAMWFAGRPDIQPMSPTLPSFAKVGFLLFLVLHLCGLAVLPTGLLMLRQRPQPVFLAALAVMLLTGGCWFIAGEQLPYGGAFPYCTGLLSPWGTFSANLVVGNRELVLTPAIRIVISLLGCVGGAAILTATVDAIRTKNIPSPLMLFTLFQVIVLLCMPATYDRYLVILFPGVACLVATRCDGTKLFWKAGLAAIVLYGLVSIGLAHDWLAWNSARWKLGRETLAQGVQPADIEGGFEWNGWFGFTDPNRPLPSRNFRVLLSDNSTLALPFTRAFFPQVTGRFALAFTQPPNSFLVASNRYSVWLGSSPKYFLLVRHIEVKEQ
jgi:hypothetical protein